MTAPRQVLPGTTYLLTRRCAQRQFLLRPAALTNQIFGYLLAVAAHRFGLQVHAFCIMSNHVHLVITDPEARLPAFAQYLGSLAARSLNAVLGRWESFWAPGSYSAVALVSPRDVVDKVAYVLANPVAAGLVRRGRDWPGLWSSPESVGAAPLAFERPGRFFRSHGKMPAHASLPLAVPPCFASAEAFRGAVSEALASTEAVAAASRDATGLGFLGVDRVVAQRPTARATVGEPRRGVAPRVACRDKWKRIEVLARLDAFLRDYRRAWDAWRRRARGVVFPAGTYLVRVTHGVPCARPS
jgi:putative transposase